MELSDLEPGASHSESVHKTMKPKKQSTLWRWNIGAACLQGLTGLTIMLITDKDATAPSYTFFPNNERGSDLWGPSPKQRHQVQLGYFSGVSLLISCCAHTFCSTLGRRWYEELVANSQNPIRWIEYSFSAGVLHLMLAMQSGIFDIHLNVAIFALTWTTMFFGLLQEKTNHMFQGQVEKKSLLPFYFGCVPHCCMWYIICHFFFVANPPGFVWALIFILIVVESLFAVNMYLQQIEWGPFKEYEFGEFVFITLSLTAKQLLAWVHFIGVASLND